MKTAMIDEQRADAHVVVYGDASPITEQEWHLARLVWALSEVPLVIAHTTEGWRASVGHPHSPPLQPTRSEAVAQLMQWLTDEAKRVAVWCDGKAASTRERMAEREPMAGDAARVEYAERREAQAARLRALLAGAPDAAHGGPRG